MTAQPTRIDPRISSSFSRQGLMTTFHASLVEAAGGFCRIEAPILPGATQQHGAGHAGLTFALADSAAGYAALTLMPPGQEVMTAEAKINLIAPALGERLIARGRVVKAGRRLTVVTAEVVAVTGDKEHSIAIFQGTMVPVDAATDRG
ncbi:PaaI family thioesterase [Aliigemmobacter aestuarii]|uniref:PaaI family thioesterase n=2 Tax=Aliigemmobacter aestuarii TaxID=1445661 RepID=A0A4V3V0S1_9RHOB|nr:PaaI family thioesterase [Gemmobacter aestuarii]